MGALVTALTLPTEPMSTITTPCSGFVRESIESRLAELRADCALKRHIQRSAFGRRWANSSRTEEEMDRDNGPQDAYWDELQASAQKKAVADTAGADAVLAAFIAEHRHFMGPDWIGNDHGLLCWHSITAGQPIATHYCQLEPGHSGPHADEHGRWETPRPPKPRVVAPPDLAAGEDGLGNDWGTREGPCIVRFRDFTWNKHPVRRSYSCLGCRHLSVHPEYGTTYCQHPSFLSKYGSKQSVGLGWIHQPKATVHLDFCPVLKARGVTDHLDQPDPERIDRGPEYPVHPEDRARLERLLPPPITGR